MAIRIQINGKTRDISLDDYLNKDFQELVAEDIGFEIDEAAGLLDHVADEHIEIQGLPEIPEEAPVKEKD